MECPEKSRQPDRLVRWGSGEIRRLAWNPRHNAPEPRIPTAGHTGTDGARNTNWNPISHGWQPLLLVPDQFGRESAAREPHTELRSQPKHRVVPARADG